MLRTRARVLRRRPMARSRLTALLALLLAPAGAGTGCAGGPGDSAPSGVELVADDASAVEASSCLHFLGIVDGAACPSVPARRGSWVGSALERGGWEGAPRVVCEFAWRPWLAARPDVAALEKVVDTAPTDLCSVTSAPREDGGAGFGLQPLTTLTPLSMGGAVGCDVCGLQRDGRLWLIFPPDRVLLREISVRLSDGSERFFRVDGSPQARSAIVALPPPPPGKSWARSTVPVY